MFVLIPGGLDASVMFSPMYRSTKASSEDPEDATFSSSTENDEEGATKRHQVRLPIIVCNLVPLELVLVAFLSVLLLFSS